MSLIQPDPMQARDLAIPRELSAAMWGSRGPYRELLSHTLIVYFIR
jgi:hypothetical protein